MESLQGDLFQALSHLTTDDPQIKAAVMAKNSFDQQFPGYEIIPEKKSRGKWALVWLATIVGLLGVPGILLYVLSSFQPPVPGMAGTNTFTVSTMGSAAMAQSEAGNHAEAIKNFQSYFQLGGQDVEEMALYAYSLSELGRKDEALTWSRKAVAADPKSRAARLIHDTLEVKK